MINTITVEDIREIQRSWASAVNLKNIDALMKLYAPNAVLKPTLSNSIRRTPEDIKEYFLGGKKFNDPGFFKNNIQEVRVPESAPMILGTTAIDTGTYEFIRENNTEVKAHFSFCYQMNSQNNVVILTQHSSLFVDNI